MRKLLKIVRITVTVLLGLLTLSFAFTTYERIRLPYTEEGAFFDPTSGVVYHQQAIGVYAILSLLFLTATIMLIVLFRRAKK